MSDETDLDLYQAPSSDLEPGAGPPGPPSPWPIIAGVVLIVVAGIAFYWFRSSRPEVEPPPAASAPATRPPAAPPATGREVRTNLPPLDESDTAVREIVGALSTHPLVAAWLGGDQLLRGATQVLVSISDGHALPSFVRRFAPSGEFAVRPSGGRLVIDPASYRRYDKVGEAAASIDPAAAARVYRTLRPRLDEAFGELGMPGSIDVLVQQAAGRILAVPVPDGEVAVVPKGIVYAYADPRLEALPPTSKLLLRMGPANLEKIQATVRAFVEAIGSGGEGSGDAGTRS
jgi:hypothetical protein